MARSTIPDESLDTLIDPEIRADIGDPVSLPTAAAAFYLPLLAIGVASAIYFQDTIPGQRTQPLQILSDLGIGSAVGAAMAGFTWIIGLWLRPMQCLAYEFQRVIGRIGRREIIGLALLTAAAEEVVFRGTIQPWLGYVWTSVIFGALHFLPSSVFIPWTLFATAAGFVFGSLFESRGSLLAPIAAHAVLNGINLHVIVHGRFPHAEKPSPHADSSP